MTVIKHSTVYYPLMLVGKMFQVLVVSGDDSKSLLLPKLLQHSLGYGSANHRLRASPELIY